MTESQAELPHDAAATSPAEETSPAEPTHHAPQSQPVVRPMESTRFGLSDADTLADLQEHWGSAYVIALDGDIWSATFRGTTDELRAHTGLELRTSIRADYAYRQQARPPIRGERMSM